MRGLPAAALVYARLMPPHPQGGQAHRADPEHAIQSEATRAVVDEGLEVEGPTPGASPGVEQRDQRDKQRPQDARNAVSAAAAASFTKDLADLASADPEPEMEPEVEAEELASEVEQQQPQTQRERHLDHSRSARKASVDWGGEDSPAAAADPSDSPPPREDPPPPPAPFVRVRPRARAAWLDLDDALAAGEEHGILAGYQAELAGRLIPRLTSPAWAALVEAMSLAQTPVARAFVLKALAAHRFPAELPSFAAGVRELGEDRAIRLLRARGPVPPAGPEAEPRELRLHYDPMEALFPSHPAIREGAPAEPWVLPRWLRGIPRAPLELAVVAVDQALSEDLRPSERTGDGASDALTAALAPHGETHPSLGRWLLNLCARAETRAGLVHMREAMMRARTEMAR